MLTFKAFHFDENGLATHRELMNIPGTDHTAMSRFVQEHSTPNVLGTKVAYTFLLSERGESYMVRWDK